MDFILKYEKLVIEIDEIEKKNNIDKNDKNVKFVIDIELNLKIQQRDNMRSILTQNVGISENIAPNYFNYFDKHFC
jgi:hypothetical protein